MRHDRGRLPERLDTMLETGRITAEEAARLRRAAGSEDFDEVVEAIRLRHATKLLDESVANGSVTPEEAAGLRERLHSGEDPRVLRLLRGLRRRRRSAGASQDRDTDG